MLPAKKLLLAVGGTALRRAVGLAAGAGRPSWGFAACTPRHPDRDALPSRRRLHAATAAAQAQPGVSIASDGGVDVDGRHLSGWQSRLCCHCPECWNPVARSKGIAYVDPSITVTAVSEPLLESGLVSATWSDGHVGTLATTHAAAIHDTIEVEPRPDRVPWGQPPAALAEAAVTLDDLTTAAAWSDGHPVEDLAAGQRFGGDALLTVLRALRRSGVARFRQVPTAGKEAFKELEGIKRWQRAERVLAALRMGAPWTSVFGRTFVVEDLTDEGAINHAYTRLHLALHTDLPFYREPPGIFLFQCLEAAGEGGESFYCDGFWVAEQLREHHPDAFEVLSTTPVDFRNYTSGWHLSGTHPVITLGPAGDVVRISDNMLVQDFYSSASTAGDKWAAWTKAFELWRSYVDDEQHWLRFRMRPGEVTLFDNQRVLHGRGAFTMGGAGQRRTMEGLYSDWSEANSRLWMLEQQKIACELEPGL